ncbi:MAG: hypothetical protein AB1458_13750 [Bacteroidota bacterium]
MSGGKDINEALMDAVADCKMEEVKRCLEQGADPNYFRPVGDNHMQPTTPLRLLMFRLSDSLLEDHHFPKLAEIAKLLLKYGADPKPALEIAEHRYGKYDPHAKGPFMDVWHIIANATEEQ